MGESFIFVTLHPGFPKSESLNPVLEEVPLGIQWSYKQSRGPELPVHGGAGATQGQAAAVHQAMVACTQP